LFIVHVFEPVFVNTKRWTIVPAAPESGPPTDTFMCCPLHAVGVLDAGGVVPPWPGVVAGIDCGADGDTPATGGVGTVVAPITAFDAGLEHAVSKPVKARPAVTNAATVAR
jgi:hypothetical protein